MAWSQAEVLLRGLATSIITVRYLVYCRCLQKSNTNFSPGVQTVVGKLLQLSNGVTESDREADVVM
jgi:hypothetical protein